jgi:hypothetical protein
MSGDAPEDALEEALHAGERRLDAFPNLASSLLQRANDLLKDLLDALPRKAVRSRDDLEDRLEGTTDRIQDLPRPSFGRIFAIDVKMSLT